MHGRALARVTRNLHNGETIAGFLCELSVRFGARSALIVPAPKGERRLSYRELADAAERVAAGLSRLGLRRTHKLVLWLPNVEEWLILHLAAAKLGVVTIALNTRFRAEELGKILTSAQPEAIALTPHFLGVDFAGILTSQLQKTSRIPQIITIDIEGDPAEYALPFAATPYSRLVECDEVVEREAPQPEDPVIVFTTSGTSAEPKLPVHEQAAILRHARRAAAAFELGEGDALLGYLPFCGVFGFCAVMASLAAGATCVIETVFRIGDAVDLIARYAISHLFGSDLLLEMLLATPDIDDGRLRSLRCGGFADFAGRLDAAFAEVERRLGARFTGIYGSSECLALMSCWPRPLPIATRTRMGGFLVDNQIAVRAVNPQSGEVCGHEVPGELQFRGYNVLQGYLNDPGQTAAAFAGGGWFRSGDMGYTLGDGSFVFLARLRDSLRLAGFLVDPREIEDFLMKEPGVALAQVVGVPSDRGELPIAFVQSSGPSIDPEELIAACRGRIAPYKIPHAVFVVDRFPTTQSPNGEKIQKAKLREFAIKRLEAER